MLKLCTVCNEYKSNFRVVGGKYPKVMSLCRDCENTKRTLRMKVNPCTESRLKARKKYGAKCSEMRREQTDVARWILQDAKGWDKKRNLDCDLTKEFIIETIKDGCSYCGETSLRMTLDRIDNSIGHLQSNVNSACIRCNYIRRDMPYEAWLTIVPSIRKAHEDQLFQNWIGGIKSFSELKI